VAATVLLLCAWFSRRGCKDCPTSPATGQYFAYLRGGRDVYDHDLCREVKSALKAGQTATYQRGKKAGSLLDVALGTEDVVDCDSETEDVRRIVATAKAPLRGHVERQRGEDGKEKFPFGLARCLASLHVVVGHLYARQAVGSVYLFSWGFTWVPWFFMLSGFILFSAEVAQPRENSVIEYITRRSISIYPLYAVSLLIAFGLAKSQCQAPSWEVLVTQAFLMQAWVPQFTEGTLQMQCWFLSCLLAYWAAFQPLFSCVARLPLRGTLALMLFFFLLPWLVVLLPLVGGADLEWYQEHTFGHSGTWVDLVATTLKFHPLCYWHVFLLGMLLGRLRCLLTPFTRNAGLRIFVALAAPMGYAVLLTIFTQEELRPPAAKLSTRLSVLLPLQAAVLLGLAGVPGMSTPPLARCFSRVDFLENYSYPVYVLQFIVYHLWPVTQVGLSFFLVLGLAAFSSVHLLQRPAEKLVRAKWGRKYVVPGAPLVLAGLLFLGATLVPEPNCQADIPAVVQVDDQLADVRLPLRLAGGAPNSGVLINPSLFYRGEGEDMVVAARLHRRESERSPGRYRGQQATMMQETWHSEIVIGTMPLDWRAWHKWLNSGDPSSSGLVARLAAWTGLQTSAGSRWTHLCARQTWLSENATLRKLVVTGPEDPKVFQLSSDLLLAFNSYPPSPGRISNCSQNQTVSQMYLARGIDPQDPAHTSEGVRLQCGEDHRAEKNWIPFVREGKLYFVYSISPHTVVEVGPDGQCGEKMYSQFPPLLRLQAKHPGWAFRCSAQALYIDDPAATPHLKQPHFLGLFHVVDVETHRYAHFAYRFSAEPPFEILQVSSQLPLQTAVAEEGAGGPGFAFVSSLATRNRQVIIAYTAGDRDSRALILTLWKLDSLFPNDERERRARSADCAEGGGQDDLEASQETLIEAAVAQLEG
jgi:peptidoglycan/LPS O-acetylase OafA/YrhL